ncbi:hydroxyethylthiazole kinase [Sulfurospirillum diekertiae]|nr:hydroxyethylthiazole kinase [Sulfurospirillum diekertiae]
MGASKNALGSAVAGILTMSIAGEVAEKSRGLGTFHTSLIDAISQMDVKTIFDKCNVSLIKQ